MRRSHVLALSAVLALGAAAPAAAFEVAPVGTNARNVTVTAGPSGGALLTWVADGKRVQISEFSRATGFGAVTQVFEAPTAGSIAFGALAPDRLVVLAQRSNSPTLPTEAVASERQAGTSTFGTPKTIATGATFAEVQSVASNARGDIAVVVRTGYQRVMLVTAPHGGAFGQPQAIGQEGQRFYQAAVAIGPDGRLVVAYYDGRSRVYTQRGTVGRALDAPQELSHARVYSEFHAAIDGHGNATVAFERSLDRGIVGVVAARARAGHGFGPARGLRLLHDRSHHDRSWPRPGHHPPVGR
jgi:hypothetical protein